MFSYLSTVSRRKFSLLRSSIRAWTNIADEIKNRPQLAEADMWHSRRLLRRVVASWDQERLLIRTRFAESSRRKGLCLFAVFHHTFFHVRFSFLLVQKCFERHHLNPVLKLLLSKK
jgi:hypothetical protein